MATKTLQENVNQAINDLCEIRQALINKGVECPSGTPTCEYGEKINEIKSGDTTEFKEVIERTTVNPKLPNDLTKIGNSAFRGCTNLALTELPAGVTSIEGYAFYQCTNLALTELPAGVTSIGGYAFAECKKLAFTELPSGVTSIPSYTFYRCAIKSMTFPGSIKTLGLAAFRESAIQTVIFKGTPESIGSSAFYSCMSLKTIKVPWAEGEVANAPWGASYATIVYNYTE